MSAQSAAAACVVGAPRRETRLELAQRIANAYGLVLILILTTFVVMMTLPQEGWAGRVTAVGGRWAYRDRRVHELERPPWARAPGRAPSPVVAVLVAIIAEQIPSERLLGGRVRRRLDPAGGRGHHDPAARRRRRRPRRLPHDPRGGQRLRAARPAVCVLLLAVGRWTHGGFSPAPPNRARATISSSASRPLRRPATATWSRPGRSASPRGVRDAPARSSRHPGRRAREPVASRRSKDSGRRDGGPMKPCSIGRKRDDRSRIGW